MRINVLFVCGKNRRRSPTAEKIFKNDSRINPRSAGTSEDSKRRLQAADFAWADLVVCMERKYLARIKNLFPRVENMPPIECLNISDSYTFMNPKLVGMLREGMDELLENYHAEREAAKAAAEGNEAEEE
jgi:protein-tyrosine phosphatase